MVNDKNIVVSSPEKPFLVKAQKIKKRSVYLKAEAMRIGMDGSSQHVPVKIRAYAVDAKDKIFVLRDTIFIYPSKKVYENFNR